MAHPFRLDIFLAASKGCILGGELIFDSGGGEGGLDQHYVDFLANIILSFVLGGLHYSEGEQKIDLRH